MATTRYKVEIRLFNKPIYFRSGFIGGRMERKVLVLRDDTLFRRHLCISIRDMKKLPTLRWCGLVSSEFNGVAGEASRFVLVEDERVNESKVVWSGEISEKKYNLLIRKYLHADH